jgi:RND family efflux transporter MFP subunit
MALSSRPGNVAILLAGFALFASLPGCSRGPAAGPPAAPPLTVSVATVAEREFQDFDEFTGRAEGSEFVEIRARVSGYLDKVAFKPGSFIKKDDLLFQIDPRPYQAILEQAEAQVAQAKARDQRLRADLERAKLLLAKKTYTQEEFDKVVGEAAEASSGILAAEAVVKQARLNLEFTQIKAPVSGIVSRDLVNAGNLISADETLLTTIAKYDPMFVYYDIDERVVLKILDMIREGTFKSARENRVPITMALGDSKGFPFEGFVNFVDNRIDPTTGTMRIRGEFANPLEENHSMAIAPGMFCRVRLPLGPPTKAVAISQRAIMSDQDRKLVFVVNDKNEVEPRPVTLGRIEDDKLQIVTAGLKAGDRIIVGGLMRVRPGAKVEPKPVEMSIAVR